MLPKPKQKNNGIITGHDLKSMMLEDDVYIIDVREQAEVSYLKTIPTSVNIPMATLLRHPEAYLASKAQQAVIVCNAGNRSSIVAQALRQQGYFNVVVLANGIYGFYRA